MSHKLYHGDCLDVMPTLKAASVDAVICDPPYGTTMCKWDSVIPLEAMWKEVKRVLKPGGVSAFTASQPFTSLLVVSNLKWFRYEWIWEKVNGTGFLDSRWKPHKWHENVVVFSSKKPRYHPQMVSEKNSRRCKSGDGGRDTEVYNKFGTHLVSSSEGMSLPRSIIRFPRDFQGKLHPTRKPVPLMSYLIKTYTKEGDTVLDFCMGSGTTGVASLQTKRNFVGIEKDPKYFAIAERRINKVQYFPPLF